MLALATLAACGVILASGAAGNLGEARAGIALILLGVASCALYTVLSRTLVEDFDPIIIIALQQSAGLAWALSIWPLEWNGSASAELQKLDVVEMAAGTVSGLMYYALAFWFYLSGLRSMPASRAGIFFNLIPVFGISLAALLLGERMASGQLLGGIVIVASVLAIQRLERTVNCPE